MPDRSSSPHLRLGRESAPGCPPWAGSPGGAARFSSVANEGVDNCLEYARPRGHQVQGKTASCIACHRLLFNGGMPLVDPPPENCARCANSLAAGEAVELVTAWSQHVARVNNLRVVVIKGDTLYRQGLRAARVSADVDVLVDPASFEEYCAVLVRAGWERRRSSFINARTSVHSRSFTSPGWPCDIDVHQFFPGFLRDPRTVFEVLWRESATLRFAHQPVVVTGRASSVLILGLHSLRDGAAALRNRNDIADLCQAEISDMERNQIAILAHETWSAAALEDLFVLLRVAAHPEPAELSSPGLREWRGRVASRAEKPYAWYVLYLSTPWRRRPQILWRALWPSRIDIVDAHPEAATKPLLRGKLRLGRYVRAVRGVRLSVRAAQVRSQR
jgi:hypothetical protein